MKVSAQAIIYFLGGAILIGLFLTLELPHLVKTNQNMHSFLIKEGYSQIQLISDKTKASALKCINTIESTLVESAIFSAVKNNENRIVLACFTSFVFKVYDTKEVPTLPLMVSKESAIIAYSKENNKKALELIKQVIQQQ